MRHLYWFIFVLSVLVCLSTGCVLSGPKYNWSENIALSASSGRAGSESLDSPMHDDNINTWKSGVVRALKTFIPDGTKVNDKVCAECTDGCIVYEEGCLKCVNCGYSKCG